MPCLIYLVEPGLFVVSGGLEKRDNVSIEESVGVSSGEIARACDEFFGNLSVENEAHPFLSGLGGQMFDVVAVVP